MYLAGQDAVGGDAWQVGVHLGICRGIARCDATCALTDSPIKSTLVSCMKECCKTVGRCDIQYSFHWRKCHCWFRKCVETPKNRQDA